MPPSHGGWAPPHSGQTLSRTAFLIRAGEAYAGAFRPLAGVTG